MTHPETGALVRVYRLPWPQTFSPVTRTAVAEPTNPEGAVFAEQGTKLLNTAAKIAELVSRYQAMDEHPEVEFRATCHGHDVEWTNFLYTP
ncbi:hypothetical protein IU433_16775 [Nocardia puris]|uniref:Uncharacterized protein n=1 Tax=Nocardia puris TaxID=208602 RepID=A0A366CYU9_9NOCA|nr:hypothetical protein [Nocardia puris]MBF6211665.1 hypothetical protein [Nocardia puris]MBF6365669.1 hypothetical protein [Nocardia puris]MBF6460689.1 hypothetical protein [Nocardia puris]RBO83007.1 hypothetical protein DFR74_1206 [Nocardia puris]